MRIQLLLLFCGVKLWSSAKGKVVEHNEAKQTLNEAKQIPNEVNQMSDEANQMLNERTKCPAKQTALGLLNTKSFTEGICIQSISGVLG